ncbi:hypothetical protein NC652_007228 [Populus alba x Populus x berolinensis]|nr:hypothetical protein NC652_007228 [Populus alba x Populus x berolinensis]
MYGWLDRQLLLSSFISKSAVSPTISMAGRSAPLKFGFSAPSPFLGCLLGGFCGSQGRFVEVGMFRWLVCGRRKELVFGC